MDTDGLSGDEGIFWTNLSSSHVNWQQFSDDAGGIPVVSDLGWSPFRERLLLDFSDECLDRNLLMVADSWFDSRTWPWTNLTMRAELCTTNFYEATLPVNASITSTAQVVAFDKNEFARRRHPVSKDIFDMEQFNVLAFQGNHPKSLTRGKIYSYAPGRVPLIDALLSESGYNRSSFMKDEDLGARATRLHSRFFNELMMSSVKQQNTPVLENFQGRSIILERRVFVVPEIGIALAVLLFVLACYLLGLLRAVSVRRRPLNLSSDPATTIGLATYLNQNSDLVTRSSLNAHASREQVGVANTIHDTPTAYDPGQAGESLRQMSSSTLFRG